MMSGGVIRFGVRSADGRRSGVFRVWANRGKSDVYIAARSIAGDYKVSLHASGVWQTGLTMDHAEGRSPATRCRDPVAEPGTRIQDRWSRPAPGYPGVTRAFAVVVSAGGVVLTEDPAAKGADIVWYPRPESNPSVEFNIYLTSPAAVVSSWPGRRGMGTAYIGSFELANGEKVWVVAHEPDVLPDLPDMQLPLLEGESKAEAVRRLFGDGPYDSLRGLAYGKDDNVRWFVETALQITPQAEALGS